MKKIILIFFLINSTIGFGQKPTSFSSITKSKFEELAKRRDASEYENIIFCEAGTYWGQIFSQKRCDNEELPTKLSAIPPCFGCITRSFLSDIENLQKRDFDGFEKLISKNIPKIYSNNIF